jgi:hypothetical protein
VESDWTKEKRITEMILDDEVIFRISGEYSSKLGFSPYHVSLEMKKACPFDRPFSVENNLFFARTWAEWVVLLGGQGET